MATYRYLLDTNILSELIRRPSGDVARKIASLNIEAACCTSLIVACELRYGAHKKGSQTLIARVDQLLETIAVLPLKDNILPHYAQIRVALERMGQPIGHNDLLIASHARALGLTVVTANSSEYSRVPDLMLKNWLE